jgi:hypothetical protein
VKVDSAEGQEADLEVVDLVEDTQVGINKYINYRKHRSLPEQGR